MGQAGSRQRRQTAPQQKRENEEVPPETNVSCSGCNSVFCQWRNIQPGNWQKGSKAAWYIDEMHGVDVVETAEGAWSKLRVDGAVHENAVMWHRAQCSTCSRPVGVQRGITNPALGIAEDRKGWFLVCCSDVTREHLPDPAARRCLCYLPPRGARLHDEASEAPCTSH
jgi:hypothetical protein